MDNKYVLQSLPAIQRDFVREDRGMAVSEKIYVSAKFGKSGLSHGAQNNWSPSAFQRPGWSRERKRSSVIYQPTAQSKEVGLPRRNSLLKKCMYFKPAQTCLMFR